MDKQDRQAPYTSRLLSELAALAPWAGPLTSIFIGGGTPTLLRPELWQSLLTHLRQVFNLPAPDFKPLSDPLLCETPASLPTPRHSPFEFTVECNPETATPELMAILAQGGVNRISVGAQSFNPAHLKTLERWHDPQNVLRALQMAYEAGITRQSLDLIYAIPGQSMDDWDKDLDTALAVGTTHLSCYSLTYEPGTAMTARLSRGEFPRADEDLEADMFSLTLAKLRSRGFERYEVSNFAMPGEECRHNLAYWRQDSWLAAGPSASAHVHGNRWKNIGRLDDYLTQGNNGFAPITDFEAADAKRNLSERLMTGLRIAEGIDAPRALDDAGLAADSLYAAVTRNVAKGLITERAGRWTLTDDGFMLADGIAVELMGALDECQ